MGGKTDQLRSNGAMVSFSLGIYIKILDIRWLVASQSILSFLIFLYILHTLGGLLGHLFFSFAFSFSSGREHRLNLFYNILCPFLVIPIYESAGISG